jgi:hypothetical protein
VAWSTETSVTITTTTETSVSVTTATVIATPTWEPCVKNGGFENTTDPDYGWSLPNPTSDTKADIVGLNTTTGKQGSNGSIKAVRLWAQKSNKEIVVTQTLDW